MSAVSAQSLIDLAHRRAEGDRDRLLLAMVDLCTEFEEARQPEVRGLLGDVFVALVGRAEREIRKALAERLASADWAPKALIDILALDEIEIARPVIRESPLLQDEDLLHILVKAAIEHQVEVARRPGVGGPVVDAILDRGEPSVLAALAGNTETDLSEEAMRRLVTASRRILALRSPLVRHHQLTRPLAKQLYGWIGESLRTALCDRFQVDPEELSRAVGEAVETAHARPPSRAKAPEDEAEKAARRHVAKLQSAGELRPDDLLRALQDGKLDQFKAALAALGDFTPSEVRRACEAPHPELLALACAAVGVDRFAFASLLASVRELNEGRPGGGADAGKRAVAAFSRDPSSAARAFRELAAGV